MATVEEIMKEVLRELSSAAGLGVQIHAEDRIAYRISRLYRTLFTQFWWDDHFKTKVVNLDGSGSFAMDLKTEIVRTKDIHSVYYGKETTPLGWMPKGMNIQTLRHRSLIPSVSSNAIFSFGPLDTTGSVTINYRTFRETNFELDDDVPLDKDLLVFGVAAWYAMSDGLNDMLAQRLQQEFKQQLDLLSKSEIRPAYNYGGPQGDVMTDWYVS